ncbi:MAG: sulfide/dihydroorotate dehydrogenase-like FAD/NAD-binding protein [Micrococcales bacterium]|nr:sulfide/dihydroorotate dehydrogenase-like FAD/NAD-binding protein [Micrococcales bacterium]
MTTTTDQARRWLGARDQLDAALDEVEELEESPGVATFQSQMDLLQRRLLTEPRAFREMFIADGMAAIAEEFAQGNELSAQFTGDLWEVLLAGGDAAIVLQRFLWALPVGRKRIFIRALEAHLSQRYPMFVGLGAAWPAGTAIDPYIREPEDRSEDFELVNKGYLGYRDLGYSLREVELLVWLEALRDKQCAEKPCELGLFLGAHAAPKGGCPVKVHIPEMFDLLAQGRFDEALAQLEAVNPLPNVTGRVCPQELQCQGVCIHKRPMTIGQVEWFLPEWDKAANPGAAVQRYQGRPDPWTVATKPPVAIVGSGPSGLIAAFLLAADGFPVTVFEAFHELGGVLRYGIPEFRLPNSLIDDVAEKIEALGGRFVRNFVVGKTATLQELVDAGFWKIFVGSGAGLPRFMNVPGEHLLNVMSANEFLTRVNLMKGNSPDHETPLPEIPGKQVLVIGGGNTAMDAARTARRLGGHVTIVYRRTRAEMPARVEELEHALEEGIDLAVLRGPTEFHGNESGFVTSASVDIMELGEPDDSGRRRPIAAGRSVEMSADLVIMALGNSANPIIKDSEPRLTTTRWGSIELRESGSQETSLGGVFTGGDAARGGSTAIMAAGDGQSAAREIKASLNVSGSRVVAMVDGAREYTDKASSRAAIVRKRHLSEGIEEFEIHAPAVAAAAKAGQFVRVLATDDGELIPLTLADWDVEAGTVTLVVQAMGTSSILINKMEVGDALTGIAGPLGVPSELHHYPPDSTVVFTAGGLGLPPVYPIMREHLRLGNHVTLITGFRSKDLMFWDGAQDRVGELQAEFRDQLEVIYATNDGTFGVKGFVTAPLEEMLHAQRAGRAARKIAEVTTIGPPLMMRAVSDLTKRFGVRCIASLNSIMVDATGMCGACMVPITQGDRLIRKHACIDGPEIDAHTIDWDKFLPRFNLFKKQEAASRARHNL